MSVCGRYWMLLCLSPFLHDFPKPPSSFFTHTANRSTRACVNRIHSKTITVPVVDFTRAALDTAVSQNKLALFDIQNFDVKTMFSGLQAFTVRDNHYFTTNTDAHGSGGFKFKQVFDFKDNKNLKHIEDGTYPEKAPPPMTPTDILNESCPQNSSFLETWLTCQKFIQETSSSQYRRAQP